MGSSIYSINLKRTETGDTMYVKKILFTLLISALLVGGACAASVNDFTVDKAYKNIYSSDYYSAYTNDKQDSGILIFRNVDDDAYENKINDDILDHTIHHDGREYITADDDLKITKNANNTANFTDYDHATHGVSEVVKVNGEEFIVVCWAKDSSNINTAQLLSALNDFNKNNTVNTIAF